MEWAFFLKAPRSGFSVPEDPFWVRSLAEIQETLPLACFCSEMPRKAAQAGGVAARGVATHRDKHLLVERFLDGQIPLLWRVDL